MEKKFQVFVSSPQQDLIVEREAVVKTILSAGHIPVGMEMFNAADESSWKLITRYIDTTDFYVLILAHRYGSLAGDISFTEKEFDYAVSKGIPCFAFVIARNEYWPGDRYDTNKELIEKLVAFKAKISRQVDFWTNADDLAKQVTLCLFKNLAIHDRPGWVRGDTVPNANVLQQLSNLMTENERLRAQIQTGVTNVPDISFEATEMVVSMNKAAYQGYPFCKASFVVAPKNAQTAVLTEKGISVTIDNDKGDRLKMNLVSGHLYVNADSQNIKGQSMMSISGPCQMVLQYVNKDNPSFEMTPQLKIEWRFSPTGFETTFVSEKWLILVNGVNWQPIDDDLRTMLARNQ